MKNKIAKGFMCLTTWRFEYQEGASGPFKIYDSLDECLADCNCCEECGVVELKLTEIGYATDPVPFSERKAVKVLKNNKKVKKSAKNNKKRKT